MISIANPVSIQPSLEHAFADYALIDGGAFLIIGFVSLRKLGGYDVMAACQLPKLNARVRFPLPAPPG
jgi:hypothetical protein